MRHAHAGKTDHPARVLVRTGEAVSGLREAPAPSLVAPRVILRQPGWARRGGPRPVGPAEPRSAASTLRALRAAAAAPPRREGRAGLLSEGLRFLCAGGVATACHYLLLMLLVEVAGFAPAPASVTGYAASSALNYWMRRRFVFRSGVGHRQAVPRYLAATATGLGLNGSVMWLGAHVIGLPYMAVQVAATLLTLFWNFAAHRLWTFREG